jgi:hypothetical protein
MTRIVADVAATGDTVGAVTRAEPTKVTSHSDEHEIAVRCAHNVRLVRKRR